MTGYRHALLIGTEIYRDERFARLPSTRADTEQLAAVLRDRAIGGFEVTTRSELTAADMCSAVREFCFQRSPEDLALIFITGHGARAADGRFVFVAYDTDADALVETGVRAETVNDDLEGCLAGRRIAIFDTCESGSFAVGFRSSGRTARDMQPSRRPAALPMTPRGVYVLASCDATQRAYEGGGTVAEPEPSVFTGAMVDVLRTGAAGTSAQGAVSVDDLFEAVAHRLLGSDPPQTPVKSAVRVTGAIAVAARPLGGAARFIARLDRPDLRPAPDGVGVPDRPRLFAYYSDVVRAEIDKMPLLAVRGHDYVPVHGAERALCGLTDTDDCIPAPEGSGHLIQASRERYGPQLWMGWPAVVLYDRDVVFAPLLIRHVEVVDGPDGVRLRVDGPIAPHPGLMARRLGPDDADNLRSSYRTTWHRGEYDRMAFDARQLLEDDFALPCVEELRPDALSDGIDLGTANEGARNVAVLFTTDTSAFTSNLLKDLDGICSNPTAIEDTALIALYPGGDNPALCPQPPLVTPLAANPAQRAVLQSAMTRRLTVATGPPGTGKSQLVVNVVATAVAAGQTVLVASTNNEAVNEVHRRCAELMQGMLIRTGSRDLRSGEATELGELSAAQRPRPNTQTRRHALLTADGHRSSLDELLTTAAAADRELLELGQRLESAQTYLGRRLIEIDDLLGPRWRHRAEGLAQTPWFGRWRRRKFLAPLALPDDADTVAVCVRLDELAQLGARYQKVRADVDRDVDDSGRERSVAWVDDGLTRASTELVGGVVADRAATGAPQIRDLSRATGRYDADWHDRDKALPHVGGWAVTSLSARRFRPTPGMFDLVVVDEASQCSIPSVVPLLYRAQRALMIGDAMQLPHISKMDGDTDRALRGHRDISPDWLDEHRLSPVRHSAFAAADRATGETLLLDEHYRCHPDIAAVPNRLFYFGQLTVLTDTSRHVQGAGSAIEWRHVRGTARPGPSGTSWLNEAEVEAVAEVVEELLDVLPADATVGVVTPYRPQANAIRARLRGYADEVRVGTAHAFQGGERDVMVLSLVADGLGSPRRFDWVDQQPELWNVAITRARAKLVVIGDQDVWRRRGRVGGDLLAAAAAPDEAVGRPADADLVGRLYRALTAIPAASVELGVTVNGHRTDAVISVGGRTVPILLDPGPADGADPAAHLRTMLRRRALLGVDAVRLPAWRLLDDPGHLRRRLGW